MTIGFPEDLQWLGWVVGMEWPEADEDSLRRIADAWRDAASDFNGLTSELNAAASAVLDSLEGETFEALESRFAELVSGDGSPAEIAKAARLLAEMSDATATNVEYTKLMFIAQLIVLAIEIAIAIAEAVPTLGASLAQIPIFQAITRVAVRLLTRELLEKITATVARRVALKLLAAVGAGAAINAALAAAMEGAVQGIQLAKGSRKDFDLGQFGKTVATEGIGGAVGGPVGATGRRFVSQGPSRLGRFTSNAAVGGLEGLTSAAASMGAGVALFGDQFDVRGLIGGGLSGAMPAGISGLRSSDGPAGHSTDAGNGPVPDTQAPGELGTGDRGRSSESGDSGTDGLGGDRGASSDAGSSTGDGAPATHQADSAATPSESSTGQTQTPDTNQDGDSSGPPSGPRTVTPDTSGDGASPQGTSPQGAGPQGAGPQGAGPQEAGAGPSPGGDGPGGDGPGSTVLPDQDATGPGATTQTGSDGDSSSTGVPSQTDTGTDPGTGVVEPNSGDTATGGDGPAGPTEVSPASTDSTAVESGDRAPTDSESTTSTPAGTGMAGAGAVGPATTGSPANRPDPARTDPNAAKRDADTKSADELRSDETKDTDDAKSAEESKAPDDSKAGEDTTVAENSNVENDAKAADDTTAVDDTASTQKATESDSQQAGIDQDTPSTLTDPDNQTGPVVDTADAAATTTQDSTVDQQETATDPGARDDADATSNDRDGDNADRGEDGNADDSTKVPDDGQIPQKVLDQLVANPDAVYGFEPKPGDPLTKLAIDWTNPEEVARAREARAKYHNDEQALARMLAERREAGISPEQYARELVHERNQLRAQSYIEAGNFDKLAKMRERNLREYGNPDGPTPEMLLDKYGSWDEVAEASFRSNRAMDVLVGLDPWRTSNDLDTTTRDADDSTGDRDGDTTDGEGDRTDPTDDSAGDDSGRVPPGDDTTGHASPDDTQDILAQVAADRRFTLPEALDVVHRATEVGQDGLDIFTDAELDLLMEINRRIPMPDLNTTVFQKVILGGQLDSILAQIKDPSQPFSPNPKFKAEGITGFIAVAADMQPIMEGEGIPERLYEAVQLGYPGSQYSPAMSHMYVLRGILDEESAVIRPARALFDTWNARHPNARESPPPGIERGPKEAKPPHTGTGLPGGRSFGAPEYSLAQAGQLRPGAELILVGADGAQTPVAVLRENANHDLAWHPVDDSSTNAPDTADLTAGPKPSVTVEELAAGQLPRQSESAGLPRPVDDAVVGEPGRCVPDALSHLSDFSGRQMDSHVDREVGVEGVSGRELEARAGGELRVISGMAELAQRLRDLGPGSMAILAAEHSPGARPGEVGAHAYAVINRDGDIEVWDPATRTRVDLPENFASRAWAVTFDSDGNPIHPRDHATSPRDGELDVREPGDRGPEARIGGLRNDLVGQAQMPEGHPRPEFTNEVDVTGKDVPGKRTPFAARTDLEPNTLYHVEGRGDFYTDHTGRVVFVEATYGVKGNLNADLNRPQPDTTYVVHPDVTNPIPGVSHAHVFETDHLGRVVTAHTDALAPGDASRSESIQQRVGNVGGGGYDGGHIFGNFFAGGPESVNLIPMLEAINRGSGDSFFNLEGTLRGELTANPPPIIPFTVEVYHATNSRVPSKFSVEYRVGDGDSVKRRFRNAG